MNLLQELEARGLVQDATDRAELGELLSGRPVPFYCGFDPTGTSLHVGSLVPIAVLSRLQRAGHQPVVLVGGATGLVGDPSGKSKERQLLDEDTLRGNIAAVQHQLSLFLDFDAGDSGAVMVNNRDWLGRLGFLEFLRDVGKHITVNYMTAKESVRARLEDRDQGISYTEFSYMLLQAFDFVHLARAHGCRLQVGGSDQWGNITAGIELYRKMGGLEHLFGLVFPLLLDAQGQKLGKTAAGTHTWLDPSRTSPYAFYQFWVNVEDADVERFLRYFSSRPLDEIAEIAARHQESPDQRMGQKILAEEMAVWVHGTENARRAIAASHVMFGGSLDDLTDSDLEPLLGDVPSSTLSRRELQEGIPVVDMLAKTGLAKSKGAARRTLRQGGVYVNNRRLAEERPLSTADLGTETMLVLRMGKRDYHLVRVR